MKVFTDTAEYESTQKDEKRRYHDNLNINPLTCSKQLFSNSKQYTVEEDNNLPMLNGTNCNSIEIRLEILNKVCSETTVKS